MSDWWARQLGGLVPTQPVPQERQGPTTAPVYPQKAVRWQPQYPPTGPRQEVTEWDQPGSDADDSWHRVRRQGYVEKAPGSVGKSGRCPSCNGSSFFRRKGPMGIEAAPLCTDCGYNGELFEQSGKLLDMAGVRSSGPTQFARSDNPGAESHFGQEANMPTEFSWSNVR